MTVKLDYWTLLLDQWTLQLDHWTLQLDHLTLLLDNWNLSLGHRTLLLDHWTIHPKLELDATPCTLDPRLPEQPIRSLDPPPQSLTLPLDR